MGANKIKYFTLLLVLLTSIVYPQAEYIPSDHNIYEFLNRLDSYHIIHGFNDIERPITRRETAGYLSIILSHEQELSPIDRRILYDYLSEFEFELKGTMTGSKRVFGGGYKFFDQRESYLYYSSDTSGSGIFVNFSGALQHIPYYNYDDKKYLNATFLEYGGILRGTILNRFGFYLSGTNGKVWGDRNPALTLNELRFNYKYNTDPRLHTAIDYIDNTEGHFSIDFENVRFKIGRDYKQIGFGQINYILGNNIPRFDYISLDLKYRIFSFSYFHGKLLGNMISSRTDSIQGALKDIADKFMVYHRLGLDFSNHFAMGAGELVIYGNRSVDFSYLNPFNFYKSVEHSNQDRDNSMMFLDISNNSIKGLKFVGAVLLDDIDFGKVGSGWFGNQLLYNLSIYSANLNPVLPVDIGLQYIRVEPYVFTHRIHNNSFSNNGFGLAAPIKPNSEIYAFRINYRPLHRLFMNLEFTYMKHGANLKDSNGNVIRNVGGDVLIGHREFDPVNAAFLDGFREYYRNVTLEAVFEPYNNYFIISRLDYRNDSLQGGKLNFLAAYIVFDIRI